MMEKQKRKSLDMLHSSLWNKLPLFALPVAATAILEQLFNASDIVVVGNFTGAGKTIAVVAVGANSSIIIALLAGIGVAIATVISNAVSSILLFYHLIKTQELIHLEWKQLKID